MNWIILLRALPELIRLVQSLVIQIEGRGVSQKEKPREVKEKLDQMAKAIKEKDEKKLNDIFDSL